MTEVTTTEPCVSLQFEPDGSLVLTVAARLQPGGPVWPAALAGAWFARCWQRAEMACLGAQVHQAPASGAEGRLVGVGDQRWQAAAAAGPAAEGSPLPPHPELELTLVENGTLPAEPPSAAPAPAPIEAEAEPPRPRIPERSAESDDQKKVIRSLNRIGRPLSVAELKREASLSEYRIKKALGELVERGLLQEERAEVGGRWKEVALYSGVGPG